MSVSSPPRPTELGDLPFVDPEALIKEARQRARRRRQRYVAGLLAAVLGVLLVSSLLEAGRAGSGGGSASPASARSATSANVALPEELSFNANGGVFVVRRDGTRRALAPGGNEARQIRMFSGVEWSPDGSKLLALRARGSGQELVVISADGTVGTTIGRHVVDGRWSPDGARIAFVRHEPGSGRVLYVATSNGRRVTRIATHLQVGGDNDFSWSPDGTKLAYAAQGASGPFIADANGRLAPRPVPTAAGAVLAPAEGVTGVQWSPDGSLVAFTDSDYNVYGVHPDGTSLRRIGNGYGIVWSPDSKLLAVAGPPGGAFGDVSVVRADGTGSRRIARCSCGLRTASGQSIAWSTDGRRIAYISGRGNTLSTVRPDGSGAIVVATQPTPPSDGLLPGGELWRPLSRS